MSQLPDDAQLKDYIDWEVHPLLDRIKVEDILKDQEYYSDSDYFPMGLSEEEAEYLALLNDLIAQLENEGNEGWEDGTLVTEDIRKEIIISIYRDINIPKMEMRDTFGYLEGYKDIDWSGLPWSAINWDDVVEAYLDDADYAEITFLGVSFYLDI